MRTVLAMVALCVTGCGAKPGAVTQVQAGTEKARTIELPKQAADTQPVAVQKPGTVQKVTPVQPAAVQPKAADEPWLSMSKGEALVGDLAFSIQSAEVSRIDLRDRFNQPIFYNDSVLILALNIRNSSKTKLYTIKNFENGGATLRDEFDNSYPCPAFPKGAQWAPWVVAGPTWRMPPDKMSGGLLLFAPPIDQAKTLFLELESSQGFGRTIRLRFSTSLVKHAKVAE